MAHGCGSCLDVVFVDKLNGAALEAVEVSVACCSDHGVFGWVAEDALPE